MMAPEPVMAERAYHHLKADIMSGRFPIGSMIIERVIASEYGVSVSPLRDGAQRLVGERLLEIGPSGGYRVPLITARGLGDLYGWHGQLVRSVLKGQPAPLTTPAARAIDSARIELSGPFDATAVAEAAACLFRTLATLSDNREVELALQSVNDRLHAIRLHEANVLSQLEDEWKDLVSAMRNGSASDRLGALWAYHRRRIRRAEKFAGVLCEI